MDGLSGPRRRGGQAGDGWLRGAGAQPAQYDSGPRGGRVQFGPRFTALQSRFAGSWRMVSCALHDLVAASHHPPQARRPRGPRGLTLMRWWWHFILLATLVAASGVIAQPVAAHATAIL